MRITAGANASRKVEGVMGDTRKYTGNVFSSCVTPAYINALRMMALTEKQQKVQVCKKQPGKIIIGVKRADKKQWMK